MPTPTPPAQLIDHIAQGKCVLFVGAGMSMQAGMPSWPGLLEIVIEQLDNLQPGEKEELSKLISRRKLLEVAEYCKAKDEVEFNSILEDKLRGGNCPIPETHEILSRVPFAGVVTTNYDKLLERAWRSQHDGEPKVLTHMDVKGLGRILLSGGYFLLKAHGDIDRPKSIVLTASDYQRVIHGNTAFESVFSAILLTRAILFVGYSLNDPDFALMMEQPLRRFEGFVPPRYAVMSEVGEIERHVLARTTGIRVISYSNQDGTHSEVVDFLRALEEATVAPSPRQPLPRADVTPRARGSTPLLTKIFAVRSKDSVDSSPDSGTPPLSLRLELSGNQLRMSLSSGNESWSTGIPDWKVVRTRLKGLLAKPDLAESALATVGWTLGQYLHEELLAQLASLPKETLLGLYLADEIRSLPWEWLQIGEPNHADFLNQRFCLFRGDTAIGENIQDYTVRAPQRILLLADPSVASIGSLPGALDECTNIRAMFSNRPGTEITMLSRDDATYAALADVLRSTSFDIIHFAGHAWADAESSFLILAGDEVVRAADIGYMLRARPPALLFLNSHFTSFVPLGMEERAASSPGEKQAFASTGTGRSGFGSVATEAGVGAFVGTCHDALSDMGAREIAECFYQRLLEGRTVAEALRAASSGQRATGNPEGLFYTLSGNPKVRLDSA